LCTRSREVGDLIMARRGEPDDAKTAGVFSGRIVSRSVCPPECRYGSEGSWEIMKSAVLPILIAVSAWAARRQSRPRLGGRRRGMDREVRPATALTAPTAAG
jgi:hypothetical protein